MNQELADVLMKLGLGGPKRFYFKHDDDDYTPTVGRVVDIVLNTVFDPVLLKVQTMGSDMTGGVLWIPWHALHSYYDATTEDLL